MIKILREISVHPWTADTLPFANHEGVGAETLLKGPLDEGPKDLILFQRLPDGDGKLQSLKEILSDQGWMPVANSYLFGICAGHRRVHQDLGFLVSPDVRCPWRLGLLTSLDFGETPPVWPNRPQVKTSLAPVRSAGSLEGLVAQRLVDSFGPHWVYVVEKVGGG